MSRRARASGARWTTDAGIGVLLEESHALPLVDVDLILRAGALHDPVGKEGLARLAARMLRMGTRKLTSDAVDEAIDATGASVSIDVGHGTTRIHASVIRRSLPALFDLLGSLLRAPALRASDLGLLQRETVSDLLSQRDNDRWLAGRAFRGHLFGDHPYGRPAVGSAATVVASTRKDVEAYLETHLVAPGLTIGVSGAVTESDLKALIDRAFGALRTGQPQPIAVAAPRVERGRRVLVVDKPDRTQTQVFVGTLGTRFRDPVFYPLVVANTAFGGTFTSRLVREVRGERGWSYAASSRLGVDRQREAWALYTHPSNEHVADCIALELGLIDAFVEQGITAEELAAARSFLVKSHAFDRDTASKRLEPRLEGEIHGLPEAFYSRYVEHVGGVTVEQARDAVRSRLSARDLSIVLVASAAEVAGPLAKLPGVAQVEVVPFDAV